MGPQLAIEKFNGGDGPRYRLKGFNGEIFLTSEAYANRSNRNRAVTRLKQIFGDAAIVVDG